MTSKCLFADLPRDFEKEELETLIGALNDNGNDFENN